MRFFYAETLARLFADRYPYADMTQAIGKFGDGDIERAEDARQMRALSLFTIVTSIPLFGFGIVQYTSGHALVGAVEIIAALLLVANVVAHRFHGRIFFAKATFLILVNAVLLAIQPSGGIAGTAIYWLFAYPSAVFLFMGLRHGMIFNSIFFVSVAVVIAGHVAGLYPMYYNMTQHRQAWAALFVAALIGYAAESAWERLHDVILARRERLRVLLENIPAGIIMVEAEDGSAVTNKSIERVLGRPISSVYKSENFAKTYGLTQENGAPYPDDDVPLAVTLKKGTSAVQNDLFVEKPNGEQAVLRVSAAPVRDKNGKVSAAVAIFEDRTKEHEIDRMKSEFVSFASHQLKSPLTGIKWAVDALLDDEGGALPPAKKAAVGEISAVVDRLSRLVSDLLSVSRIDTGTKFTLDRRPTNVTPILHEVIKELEPAAAKRGVTVSGRALPKEFVLYVDAEKFKEVFLNLVGNAIKYSQRGGSVAVGLQPEDGEDTLYVRDDGVGIPAAAQSKIFERFYRADNVAESEGTGLGLYIAKSIVAKHGGRIWFISKEGIGTTFYVAIPPLP